VAQAVASALGIPLSAVVVGDNSTSIIPNGGCTGGSGTSESCVGATLNACASLKVPLMMVKGSSDSAVPSDLLTSGFTLVNENLSV
jgi:CO/xanthine dehydrogenase Mo-binding subunit